MKKILLVLLLIEVCSCLSQNDCNRAFHTDNQFPNPAVAEISGDLYFSTLRKGSAFGLCHLYKMGINGNVKFQTSALGYNTIHKSYKTLDSKLIVVGVESFCDVYYSTQNNFIAKIDTNGNMIFNVQFVTLNGDNPVATVQTADSSFYTFTDSLVFH
ncbi:MAG: hypothetical protein JNL60_01650, partial [Bacteroidia bacterium]|nr:hypothetical protein [Bacteroidia bacterium]